MSGLDTAQIVTIVIVVFVASTVQTVGGFGFSLLSVPLMSLTVETQTAVVIATLTAAVVTTYQAINERAEADPVLVKRITAWAYAGMPLGLVLFKLVDARALRLLVGVAVIVAVVLLTRPARPDYVPSPAMDRGAGFISGVLSTSVSTNGPPLVYVLTARSLPPDRFRATISAIFAWGNIGGIVAFAASGEIHRGGIIGALAAVPALFAGRFAGLPLRKRITGNGFRRLVLALLLAGGIAAIARSI